VSSLLEPGRQEAHRSGATRRSRSEPVETELRRFCSQVAPWLGEGLSKESLCGHRRKLGGILQPKTVENVQTILSAASAAGGVIRIHPISCGKNWGFGSDLPAKDGDFVLNLSGLSQIRSPKVETHTVEIEAGVTQGELDRWLGSIGGTHYFNVTGAGTSTSVLGNALEKGVGYSGSRHLDLLDLEVVLPGGKILRTAKHEGLEHLCAGSSLGPEVTQLFCQSAFGVVTAARIALFRRPEKMGAVLCKIYSDDYLPSLISAVSEILAEGACYGVPHIFNRERIITSLAPHLDRAGRDRLLESVAPWTALLPIKGSKAVFEANAVGLSDRLQAFGRIEILSGSNNAEEAKLNPLLQGHPSDFSLASISYAAFGEVSDQDLPPEETGAGLVHITPSMPLEGEVVRGAVDRATRFLRKRGYSQISLSINAISARCAVLVIPLAFDRRKSDETKRAHESSSELTSEFAQAGMLPYRVGLDQASRLPLMSAPWPKMFAELQKIFDPRGCLAPSRYEPLWKQSSSAEKSTDIRRSL
jgi:4-cresol dehydrogenase (hydroxylating)